MAHILVFGTSTTYGAWDTEGGWVQRLRKFLDEKIIESNHELDYLVYNLGVSGDKSTNILARFEGETQVRLTRMDKDDEAVILFHLGVNDSIYNQSQGGVEVGEDQFRENLKKLIELARKYSKKIVFIGSMPVDSRVDPMPWAPGRSYKNEYVERFNKIMAEVSSEEEVHFIEVFQNFIKEDYSPLLADGVHMTDEGHRKLYELVLDYLLDKELIKI
jgi:acyl-CoA thioesterase I